MDLLSRVFWLLAGAINAYPVIGLFVPSRLESLYGIPIAGPDLELLLRHRALLIGGVGVALLVAAFRPDWRPASAVAGFVSMLGFVAVAALVGGPNDALTRVAYADVAACAFLGAALLIDRRRAR